MIEAGSFQADPHDRDANGMIVTQTLTDHDADDQCQVGPLSLPGPVICVNALETAPSLC
jgi:hypothetical protein